MTPRVYYWTERPKLSENASPKRIDRRVKRTHRLLRDALMALIVERGYDAITVQDITDRAEVARSTFYLHFRDKDDLLNRSMSQVYEDLLAVIEPGDMGDSADFEHVAENADFYRVMLGEHGSMAFTVQMRHFLAKIMHQHVIDIIAPDGRPTRVPRDMIAHILAGMQLGLMAWWLENDMQPPPETVAEMGKNLGLQGVLWALSQPEDGETPL